MTLSQMMLLLRTVNGAGNVEEEKEELKLARDPEGFVRGKGVVSGLRIIREVYLWLMVTLRRTVQMNVLIKGKVRTAPFVALYHLINHSKKLSVRY